MSIGPPSFMLVEKDPPPGVIDFTKMAEERQQQEYEDLKDEARKRMNGETADARAPSPQ